MKKILLMTSFALSLATSAIAAQAATTDSGDINSWNVHHGYYAEFNAGANLYALGVISSGGSASASGFQGGGWSGAVGYSFSRHVAMEAGFMQNYADFEDDDGNAVAGHTNVPYLAARFTIPAGDRFAFLAKLGLMAPSVTAQATSSDGQVDDSASSPTVVLPFVGIGASYAVTPKLEVTAQFQGAVYGIVNAGLMSAGLTYHF